MIIFFKIIYILYICSIFLIGDLYIGLPLNLLQLTTLVLLILCFLSEKNIPNDANIILISVFLVFYFVSAVLTGYEIDYYKLLMSNFFISYVGYWATEILIKKYKTYTILIVPVTIIGTLNALVTIAQALNYPIPSYIIQYLMQNKDALNIVTNTGYTLGTSISGLYLTPVINGHYLLFSFIISLLCVFYRNTIRIIPFLISCIILIGLFFCQQRSPFYLSILALLYVTIKLTRYNLKFKILFFAIILVSVFVIAPHLFDYISSSGSRLLDITTTHRNIIWKEAIEFYFNHPFIGGLRLFVDKTQFWPHNLIVSGFLAGGFLGGTILLFLVVRLLIQTLNSINLFNGTNPEILIIGCLLISLILDSMTHNTGIVDGDRLTFIAISLCYYNNIQPYRMKNI